MKFMKKLLPLNYILFLFFIMLVDFSENLLAQEELTNKDARDNIIVEQQNLIKPNKEYERYMPKFEMLDEPEQSKEEVLADIKQKAGKIRDITFNYKIEKYYSERKIKTEQSKIFIKLPDKRKKISKNKKDIRLIRIENKNVSWDIIELVAAEKVISVKPVNKIDFPILKFLSEVDEYDENDKIVDEKTVDYLGIENSNYYILKQYLNYYWISKDDGYLYKHVKINQSKPYKIIRRYSNVEINRNLEDDIFEYEPPKGIFISEIDRTKKVANKGLYKKLKATEKDIAETQDKLNEINEKYDAINDFSCDYSNINYFEEVQISDDQIPGSFKFNDPNSLYNKTYSKVIQKGLLKYKKPDKLKFNFSLLNDKNKINTKNFVISDGINSWTYYPGTDKDRSRVESKFNYVINDEVNNQKENYLKMKNDLEYEIKKNLIVSMGYLDTYNINEINKPRYLQNLYVELFEYAIKPFKGIKKDKIFYLGEEVIDGEDTYKFYVQHSLYNNESEHWIGKQDGIPRKIIEYNSMDNSIKSEIYLKNVLTDLNISDDEFKFNDNDSYIIKKIKDILPVFASQYSRGYYILPKKIYEKTFDNPLNDIKDLEGFGMKLNHNKESFIRFYSEKPVILDNDSDFSEIKATKGTVDPFINIFPSDKSALEDVQNIIVKNYVKDYSYKRESYTLVVNKKENLYFFREWKVTK